MIYRKFYLFKMENNKQSIKKLSLGNTYNCLNHALWEQKKMNSVIFNENKILKTKVRFMKDVKISIY